MRRVWERQPGRGVTLQRGAEGGSRDLAVGVMYFIYFF